MSTPEPQLPEAKNLDEYLAQVVAWLRVKEAEVRRGNLQALEDLDRMTDAELLKRWAWKSSIFGFATFFVACPFSLSFMGFLPEILQILLWSAVKVMMALTLAMFAAAVYFTVKQPNKFQ